MVTPPRSRRWLFLGFLLAGMASGFFIGSLRSALAAAPLPAAKQNADVQRSSLIVLVDDMEAAQPSLRGVWLAANTGGHIQWTPLYPQPLSTSAGYAQPHTEIKLASRDLLALAELAPLRAAGAFDEVFVMDQTALGALRAAAGELRLTWTEPQAALQQQVELIQSLCAATWNDPAHLEGALALMPAHLLSSATPFELITRWDNWAQAEFGLACSHPWAD